jgi:uncharacterized protein YdeI (BOF family)
MVLDPVSLAAFAAPLLAKGAEAFTKTAGEKLGGKMVDFCEAVANKFKGDSYAEQTLARAQEMPESDDRQIALKGILAEKMKDDPEFAELAKKLFDEINNEASSNRIIFDQRGQNVGSQTNIGNVQGSVNIGTK